jgi:hypothetical protein
MDGMSAVPGICSPIGSTLIGTKTFSIDPPRTGPTETLVLVDLDHDQPKKSAWAMPRLGE